MLEQIRDKTLNGKRLDREEGRYLLTEAPLLEVGSAGQRGALRAATPSAWSPS